MSLSYHFLGRNAISGSTSTSKVSLIVLADDLPGMPSLLIAESVGHVILKSSMHSSKFSTALWSKMHYIFFLHIVNTGIKKKNVQPGLQFFDSTSLRESWLCCSVLCFYTWLAHIKMFWQDTMISHFTETSQRVQRPNKDTGYKKFHI